jgi:uncharacterized protein
MYYKREIIEKVRRLAKHFPAVVVTGARQTGKTTLLRQLFADHTYVSLDLPRNSQLAEEDPESFLRQYKRPILIDEVQYAPTLFKHLKVAIDQDRDAHGQFILTGSQKFTLMKNVSDSLAGRCGLTELETLSVSELGPTFSELLDSKGASFAVGRGFYPQLWKDLELLTSDFYSSYTATYLERDVRQLLNVVSLRDFERFMRACALRSGQLLNKSEIAREVGITAVTANEWLSILHASNQILLLEPYFGNVGKRLIKSPKLYFSDPGLLIFLLGLDSKSIEQNYLLGAIWETFIFGELRKHLPLIFPTASVWFYRDKQREIDFLIEYGGVQHLLECKWSEIPKKTDVRRLDEVSPILDNASKEAYLLCRTKSNFPITRNRIAINGFDISGFLGGFGKRGTIVET